MAEVNRDIRSLLSVRSVLGAGVAAGSIAGCATKVKAIAHDGAFVYWWSHYGLQHRSRYRWLGRVAQSGRGQVMAASSKALPAEQPGPGAGRPPGRAQRAPGRGRHGRVPE